MLLREFTDLAVNNRDAERRGLEGEAFDKLLQIRGETPAFAPIGTPLSYQARQSLDMIALYPASKCPERHLLLRGNLEQWNIFLQERAQHMKTLYSLGALLFGQFAQRCHHRKVSSFVRIASPEGS